MLTREGPQRDRGPSRVFKVRLEAGGDGVSDPVESTPEAPEAPRSAATLVPMTPAAGPRLMDICRKDRGLR
jgi:hypothetical protein